MLSLWSDLSPNSWFDLGRSLASFEQLRRDLDRLFEDYGQGYAMTNEAQGAGQAELTDNGNAYLLQAIVPGMTEKDLDVSVEGQTVTLRAERKTSVPDGYTVHRKERGSLSFARSWHLPSRVDAEHAEATLTNGVLRLSVPKAQEAQPKQIAVKAS